MNILTKE